MQQPVHNAIVTPHNDPHLCLKPQMKEVDFGSIVAKLVNLFDRWQACLADVHTPFSSDAFQLAGFRLGGGEIGIDRASATYNYSHTLDFIGVVQR